jgi:hypothetical protein
LQGMGVPLASPLRRPASDVRLPRMVYAAVAFLPVQVGEDCLKAMADMRKAPGVVAVIDFEAPRGEEGEGVRRGVAVVARGFWLARQSLARLLTQCCVDAVPVLPEAESPVCAAGVGISRGTAHIVDGRLRLWHATHDSDRSRAAAARIAGMEERHVELRVTGHQDATEGHDVLSCAIAVARALPATPVQVVVSRAMIGHWAGAQVPAAPPVLKVVGGSGSVAIAA